MRKRGLTLKTNVSQKGFVEYLHYKFHHILTLITKETEDGALKLTEDGDQKITENSL